MISTEHRSCDEPDDDLDQQTADKTQQCANGNHGDDHSRTPLAGGWCLLWCVVGRHVLFASLLDMVFGTSKISRARGRPPCDLRLQGFVGRSSLDWDRR